MVASKDQERDALKKIQKIIDDLGSDSYLSMTFSGIMDQAIDNINNDFAMNYKEMYDAAVSENKGLKADIRDKDHLIDQLRQNCADHMSEKADLEDTLKKERQVDLENVGRLNQAIGKYDAAQLEIEGLKAEIIGLKARLFDLMDK